MSRFPLLSCGVALLILSAGSANSQTTFASITGTVLDSTGAAVPNATVTSTNLATNIKNTAPINEIGIATTGMRIDRNEPRNRKMTMMTMINVSISVCVTSCSASLMYLV